MKRKLFFAILSLMLSMGMVNAQSVEKSNLHQRAEAEIGNNHPVNARSLYVLAFNDYIKQNKAEAGVECGVKAVELYYRDNLYKEAFEMLRNVDQAINSSGASGNQKAAMRYQTAKSRYNIYMKIRKTASAQEQLNNMIKQAESSGDPELQNDLLYNQTIHYYSLGQTTKGNEAFKEMTTRMTSNQSYDKIEEVYLMLIDNGRKKGSASLVAQSYSTYMTWKDSITAAQHADEIKGLKEQIAKHEATIADKDSSISSRSTVIVGLGILAAILGGALILGGIILMRFILLTRKQKKTIDTANENNALKAKFIKNISAQLDPTLQKLDARQPEVKALQQFSAHVQTLSDLETGAGGPVEKEDVQIEPFCEQLMDTIRDKVSKDIALTVNAPKMSAAINKEYVTHILTHLLNNAVYYTPAGGHINLDFKKRGPHKIQFLLSNTGENIPEENRDNVFKPFLEIRDLTNGDGLGLPICKQMAMRMDGDLSIDPAFTKGTRFVLDLAI